MKNTNTLLSSSKCLPSTSQPSSGPSTSSYVCFPCRTRCSLPQFDYHPHEFFNSHRPTCHTSKALMYHVGPKLEVPPHSNVKAWLLFYDFITRPYKTWNFRNYCAEIDPIRDEENKHWCECRLRDTPWGCERCNGIANRVLPDWEKVSLHWNAAVR